MTCLHITICKSEFQPSTYCNQLFSFLHCLYLFIYYLYCYRYYCWSDRVPTSQGLSSAKPDKIFLFPQTTKAAGFILYLCIAASVFTVVIVLYNLYQAYEPLELMPRKTDGIVKLYCCFQRALSIIIKLRVNVNSV